MYRPFQSLSYLLLCDFFLVSISDTYNCFLVAVMTTPIFFGHDLVSWSTSFCAKEGIVISPMATNLSLSAFGLDCCMQGVLLMQKFLKAEKDYFTSGLQASTLAFLIGVTLRPAVVLSFNLTNCNGVSATELVRRVRAEAGNPTMHWLGLIL